jgi:hypothetical protein
MNNPQETREISRKILRKRPVVRHKRRREDYIKMGQGIDMLDCELIYFLGIGAKAELLLTL